MTIKVLRSALVAYSAQQMFDLVNDIEAYPQYMEGCVGAEVLTRTDTWVEARLDLSKAGIRHSFITRNSLLPPQRMEIRLVRGPFRHLSGGWTFKPLAEDACKVSLELEFEFSNKLLALAANKWFEGVASTLVDALCQRAETVYKAG